VLNSLQAENAVKSLFIEKWVNGITNGLPNYGIDPLVIRKRATSGLGQLYMPEIRWQETLKPQKIDNDRHWARFTMQNVINRQASMAGGRVLAVGTRHRTQGIIIVQLFFAKSSYENEVCKKLAFITEHAFIQENVDGVWFRNTVTIELDPEDCFFRTNVNTEYEYDTVVK
jgi:hypothetical protein